MSSGNAHHTSKRSSMTNYMMIPGEGGIDSRIPSMKMSSLTCNNNSKDEDNENITTDSCFMSLEDDEDVRAKTKTSTIVDTEDFIIGQQDGNMDGDDNDDQSFLSNLSEFSWGSSNNNNNDDNKNKGQRPVKQSKVVSNSNNMMKCEDDDDDDTTTSMDSWGSAVAFETIGYDSDLPPNASPFDDDDDDVAEDGTTSSNTSVLSYFSAQQRQRNPSVLSSPFTMIQRQQNTSGAPGHPNVALSDSGAKQPHQQPVDTAKTTSLHDPPTVPLQCGSSNVMDELVAETSLLTLDENVSVLKDLYGIGDDTHTCQKRTPIKMQQQEGAEEDDDDDDDDVTEVLMEEFYCEIEKILAVDRLQGEAYATVLQKNSQVIDEESCPTLFIRRTHYDPKSAASRFLQYWQLRKQIFGPDKFCKPMTLDGAMADEIDIITQYPRLHHILPKDDNNRIVVCFDKTDFDHRSMSTMQFMRYIWYCLHMAIRLSKASRRIDATHQISKKGGGIEIVFMYIVPSFSLHEYDAELPKLMAASLERTLPIKLCAQHWILGFGPQISFFSTMVLPLILFVMGKFNRTRCQFYNYHETDKNLDKLSNFGLKRSGLPTSIGGSYTEPQYWAESCRIIQLWKEMASSHSSYPIPKNRGGSNM